MEKRLAGWKRELLRAHGLIAELFARSEPRARSLGYLQGLLSGCERKNGWQLAEWMGEAAPYAVQHLLDRARWTAGGARARRCHWSRPARPRRCSPSRRAADGARRHG